MDYAIHLPTQLREHLRALRKERGLTQAALGRLLGVGQARVAEIENNPGVVSIDQLMRVLSALQTSLVLRDEAVQAERAPLGMGKTTPKKSPHAPAKPSAVALPPTGQWQARPLTGKNKQQPTTVLVSRAGAYMSATGKTLRDVNPNADVVPTSKRNFIIRPKKGSW